MKIFVGGLSWGTDSEGLQKAFEQYGTVNEAIVIKDKYTDRSRGFGFVTFETKEAGDSTSQWLQKWKPIPRTT